MRAVPEQVPPNEQEFEAGLKSGVEETDDGEE
jgi:hypothetical protein